MAKQRWNEEDRVELLKWRRDKDPEAGNHLAAKYLPLVDGVVRKFALRLPQNVPKDDLKSWGYNGLLDALDKYDLERDVLFETYASWRIKGAILDGLRKMDWLPRSVREKARKIEEAYTVLEQTELRTVSEQEVSQYLGISHEELRSILSSYASAVTISIEEPLYDKDEQLVDSYHLIKNPHADLPEIYMDEKFMKELMAEVIERLPEKEQLVISLVYFEELSLTEVAHVMDLSTSRISQIHSKAILRLKGVLQAYKEFLPIS